jgi:hypothetical protein
MYYNLFYKAPKKYLSTENTQGFPHVEILENELSTELSTLSTGKYLTKI